MRSLESRVRKMEAALLNPDDPLADLTDAELDDLFVDAEEKLRALVPAADHPRLDEELLADQTILMGEVNLTHEAIFWPRSFELIKAACIRLARPYHPEHPSNGKSPDNALL